MKINKPVCRQLRFRPNFGRLLVVSIALVGILIVPLAYSRSSAVRTLFSRKQTQTKGPIGRKTAPTRGTGAQTGSVTQASDQISEEGKRQIAALMEEKANRTPAQQRMDSQLLQASREDRGQEMVAGINLEPVAVTKDADGKVLVDIDGTVTDDLISKIESLGGEIVYPSFEYNTIRAKILLSTSEVIAGFPDVKFIQLAMGSITSHVSESNPGDSFRSFGIDNSGKAVIPDATTIAVPHKLTFAERADRIRDQLTKALAANKAAAPLATGSVNSEGDRVHRSDDTRNSFGYLGQGVRIGVLSDSFNALGGVPADIASGNLPGPGNPLGNLTPVTVLQDIAPGQGTADEGRAMVQIVHDLAPKAQLFFATADVSEASFASNIVALRNAPNNCDIIIDDIFYFDEPVFQDGIVAQAVNTVTAAGALYFSSAGNEGNVAKGTAGYFEGDFNDAGSPAFTFPGGAKTGTIHNFGTVGTPINGDIITSIGSRYTLNWADPAGGSSNDYDLFVVSAGGTIKQQSVNIQNGTQLAFEQISPNALVAGDRLVVFKTAAAAPRAFSLNTIRGTLTINTTGQTHGHSSAVSAFSVSATPAGLSFNGVGNGPFPAAFSGTNVVEAFTSDGPRRVFFNADGTPITPGNLLFGTNGGAVRNKPDITAADGVSTTLSPTSGLNPFYGTSAAAPHAGAIAALLKGANPALTPAQIRTLLINNAIDIEGAGYDNISGFGIVQAFQSMTALTPTPQSNVVLGTVTVSEGAFSNGNGTLDPGETGNVVVQLQNLTATAATAVSAMLSTTTPGISVNQPAAAYGTIAGGANGSNTGTPFVIGVNSLVPCGTVINLSLTVNFTGGFSPQIFLFSTTVGNQPGGSINGVLGNAPPVGPGFTSTSGQQTGRISRSGVASACGTLKANPGLTTAVGSRQFDAYTFTNIGASSQCVTVTLTAANGINLYEAAYTSAGFVPSNPATNFLADSGSSSATQVFSFDAAAGSTFTIVVHDINVTPASGSPYNLSVSLANCTAGPACTPITITTAAVAGGSTGTAYSQSFAATGGSGNYTFALSGNLPAGLSFSGNTLSGTPTQAGTFAITVTASDNSGCPAGSKNFSLVIAGIPPASVTATAGGGQTVLPLKPFPTALTATVRDANNNLLPGVNVIFTAPAAGASGTFAGGSTTAIAVTNASGVATAPTFTANSTTGTFTVTATVNGVANPANFSLTSNCPTTFTVTNNTDAAAGSLRDALNNICAPSTITFAPAVTGTISLTSGEIAINKAVTITGPGANVLAISGSQLSRIFNINSGAAAVSISGLTLRDGKPVGGTTGGGAIVVSNGAAVGAFNLTDSVVTNNDVTLAGNPLGGGIDNEGATITIARSSIVNNIATFRGGGIQNQGFGTMVITDSTIAGNTAGTAGIGGGIRSLLNLTLTNCTIFGNSAQTAGNVSRSGGTITFKNTIIAGGTLVGSGGTGPDISGAGFASADFNFIQNTATGTITGTTTHNITGVNPQLLPLANYGGPEPTVLPSPTSPVLNAGDSSLVTGTDQRGFPRLIGTQADMGSVEANFALAVFSGSPQSTPITTAFALPLKAKVTENGLNVAGVTVTFTSPPLAATFPGGVGTATAVTDATGVATAPTLTATAALGTFVVTASIGPFVPPVNFVLTNAKIPVNIVVTSSTSLASAGLPVTFTATVTSTVAGQPTPTGTIQFTDNGLNIGTPVTLVNGVASRVSPGLAPGLHTIRANYSGDAIFLFGTGTLTGGQNVGFIFTDPVNGNKLTVTVPANGLSGPGTYTFTSGGVNIVTNVPAIIQFNQTVLRISTTAPSFNALFDVSSNTGQAILFDRTRNQSFIMNVTNFVLAPAANSGGSIVPSNIAGPVSRTKTAPVKVAPKASNPVAPRKGGN